MFDEQQGDAPLPDFLQEGHQFLGFPGIESGRRFIQQHEPGLLGQGPGDLQTPGLAVGQGVRGQILPLRQPHQVQQFPGLGPGLGFSLPHPAPGPQGRQRPHFQALVPPGEDVFQHAHAAEKLDVLESAGQAAPGPLIGGEAHQLLSGKDQPPGRGRQKPVDDIEAGGLARPVGADEGQDLSFGHVEGHPVQGLDAAEVPA